MNRSAPILFLATLVAFQSFAWFAVWQSMQASARRQAVLTMEQIQNQLPVKVFHKDFLRSITVADKEIRLDGSLFDFRILREQRDSTVLILYADIHEQGLLAWLCRVVVGEDAYGPRRGKMAAHWPASMLSVCFLVPVQWIFSDFNPFLNISPFFDAHLLKAQCFPCIPCPPPDRLFTPGINAPERIFWMALHTSV